MCIRKGKSNMGRFLNPDNSAFQTAVDSEIYVDKTELLDYTNRVIGTKQAFICNSRPRRFGKSVTADMLTAYYSRGCDSREIFSKFEISESPDFEKYRNKYNTIFLNMQEFLSRSDSVEALVDRVKKLVLRDLKREYPDVDYFDDTDLVESMQDIYETEKCPFVVIIDEWDCIFRAFRQNKEAQE